MSRRIRVATLAGMFWAVLGFALGFLIVLYSVPVDAKTPAVLRGQIITSATELDVPEGEEGFAEKLRSQDQSRLPRSQEGQWEIHFLAFFSRPLPTDHAGVVLLNSKGEPVTVASVEVRKGQTNLAAYLTVESTDTPKEEHTLQVYYARDNKPVILAMKPIFLE